jgi:hypothetical protein
VRGWEKLPILTRPGGRPSLSAGQGATAAVKCEGGGISWINPISKPMKIKLEFSGVVKGAEMSGKVKAGFIGSFPFTGLKEISPA